MKASPRDDGRPKDITVELVHLSMMYPGAPSDDCRSNIEMVTIELREQVQIRGRCAECCSKPHRLSVVRESACQSEEGSAHASAQFVASPRVSCQDVTTETDNCDIEKEMATTIIE